MTTIFAKPRHEYASYADLYRLIDLSGFETCFIDEIDDASDNTYLLTILNGEVRANGYLGSRARIALWDLEYHLNGIDLPGVELWAGDRWYADQIGAKYVPMGSHPDLRPNADSASPNAYDVAFIGYINGVHRRERIRQELIERGVQVSPTGAWGDERHRILSNSKAYLCVHQHDNIPTIAPLRMVVAAAYALPMISETVADKGIFDQLLLMGDYSNLVSSVEAVVLTEWIKIKHFGEQLHEQLCHGLTFRKSVEAAL